MENYVMVVAIDFGTTFSGYAFSFKDSPEEIKMNKNWGEGLGFQASKTPTCVLVNPQGDFEAFGYEAEDQYGKMVEEKGTNSEKWCIYKQFKMVLHKKKKLTRANSITSTSGHIRPAIAIFAMSLRFLKDHVLETLSRQLASPPDAKMIRWVLTVPAIWSDESKDFMREAAYEAGLMNFKDSKQLVIALEPEAASLFCRRLNLAQFNTDSNLSFKPGTKYLVIDAGGGTVDITAHEILPGDKVKELFVATGGAWGGTKVDQSFVSLLEDVLGRTFVKRYQEECPHQWLTLMVTFERMKRAAKTGKNDNLALPLSWSIGSKYKEITDKDIAATINGDKSHGVSFSNGSLIINQTALQAMFKPVIDNILSHVQDLMGNVKIHPCKYFFLVGGFGESTFLREAIQDKFCGQVDILTPSEAQMSVIKGAVLFGHNPQEITKRISRRTIGYGHMKPFDETIHDENMKAVYEGISRCRNLFGVLVKKDEEIDVGTKRKITFNPYESMQTEANFTFYAMDRQPKEPVQYTTDPGVEFLGEVAVKMPDTTGGRNREITLNVIFGGTEIQAEAIDETTKNKAQSTLKFMSSKS